MFLLSYVVECGVEGSGDGGEGKASLDCLILMEDKERMEQFLIPLNQRVNEP